MGILKSIKKVGKNIFKGVKKVYKKVSKFVGKIAKSKWGKAMLVAGAVVMGGLAIYGAIQGVSAVSAGSSFMTKFVAGSKGFMTALANPVATGKSALGALSTTGQAIQAGNAVNAASGLQGASTFAATAPELAAATPLSGGAGVLSAAPVTELSTMAATGAPAAGSIGGGAAASPGLLSRAGGAALDFAKSSGGGRILSGAVKGYAEGKAAEEMAEEERRQWDSMAWADPNKRNKLVNTMQGVQLPGIGAPGGAIPDYMPNTQVPTSEELAGYARTGG